MSAKEISTTRKRRGVDRALITHLTNRLKDLESRPGNPSTLLLTREMLKKLESLSSDLSSDFKTHHFALIDLLEEEEALEKEQEVLDEHDKPVTTLVIRIN